MDYNLSRNEGQLSKPKYLSTQPLHLKLSIQLWINVSSLTLQHFWAIIALKFQQYTLAAKNTLTTTHILPGTMDPAKPGGYSQPSAAPAHLDETDNREVP